MKTIEGHPVFSMHHSLGGYFLVAYAVSWIVWAPLAASAQGWYEGSVSPYLYALGFVGPTVVAVVVTWFHEGTAGIRRLLSQVLRYRSSIRWYLFALLAPPLLFALSAAIARRFGAPWPDWHLCGRMDDLFPGWGVCASRLGHLFIICMGEEVGWRGYALPRLQVGRSALEAIAASASSGGCTTCPRFCSNRIWLRGWGWLRDSCSLPSQWLSCTPGCTTAREVAFWWSACGVAA